MRRRKSGLRDVAQLAGVDVSTVSRVLTGNLQQRVSSETRTRILEAAKALDYQPNALARGLRTSRTATLGIVVPQLDNPVFSSAIRGAELAAGRLAYSLLIAHRDSGQRIGGAYRRLAETHRVDGLLVASLDSDRDLLVELRGTGVPFVLMNRQAAGAANAVVLDNERAARMAVGHLVGLGHRRIAHLAGRLEGYNGQGRLAGFRAALAEAGLDPQSAPVEPAGYSVEGGAAAMQRLLASGEPQPTAVFAASLISATGALGVLHAAGIAVPRGMSVVALHDAPVASMVYPALTTVRTPTQEMGEKAAEMLIGLIRGEASGGTIVLPPDDLVVRASTAPPAD
ncbi:Catabolite control protein A [Methylobacterium isbiliense]|jgi:LacI family transcriptional regulator|uniref:Catabolite control protein A n=1 Tax=Methylobacterium isbiliense TaxID=315478 RepID=A0ABQ4SIS7_9HYPH|nr:Catabolite control protein A [Methylobacterium isbiliense]